MFDFDLFVIGAGSGGVRAARMAAGYGARVAIAEDRYMGGTCVNVGCVPKKLYTYASHYRYDWQDSRGFGWQAEIPEFRWETLRDNKINEIARLNGIYDNLLQGAGVDVFDGFGGELGYKADGAHGDGDDAGKCAQPHHGGRHRNSGTRREFAKFI